MTIPLALMCNPDVRRACRRSTPSRVPGVDRRRHESDLRYRNLLFQAGTSLRFPGDAISESPISGPLIRADSCTAYLS